MNRKVRAKIPKPCIRWSSVVTLVASLAFMISQASFTQAQTTPSNVSIKGEIERITVTNPNDVWSAGTIVVGGQNVIIPRNLLIDLPANRVTLQQLFAQAPAGCVVNAQSGLAKADSCNTTGAGAFATIAANRTAGGNVIAGDVFIEKGVEVVKGVITFIDYTNGYFRLNGTPTTTQSDPGNGIMVRLNDPTSRHTVQKGPGCGTGPNCSPDPRFTEDPDNYTQLFGTGYPLCIPSTTPRTFTDTLDINSNSNTTEQLTAVSAADGTGDLLCPATNRTTPGTAPLLVNSAIQLVDDSRRFAPIKLGDSLTAKGNFETVGGVRFLSTWSTLVSGRLETKDLPNQPDYMYISEMFIDSPGFQFQRLRSLFLGVTSLDSTSTNGLLGSDVILFSTHHDPATGAMHEFPMGSTRGCDNAAGRGRCTFAEGAPNGFRIEHRFDFTSAPPAKKDEQSPCLQLRNDPRFAALNICPHTQGNVPTLEDEFGIMSPLTHETHALTGKKYADLHSGGAPVLKTVDIHGNDSPNGQYLFPMGIGLGGIEPPDFIEMNPGLLGKPINFSGIPWLLDRRLSPGGCIGPCEAAPQPLVPFPFEQEDPRTVSNNTIVAAGGAPTGQYTDPNFTASTLSVANNRILSYVDPALSIFNGDATVLAWPPVDPAALPILATNIFTPVCNVGTDTTAPTTPTGLTATAASSSQINLAWSASQDNTSVTGYRIFRDGGATAIATVNNALTFSDTGLAASSTHSYTVAAVDAANNQSAKSAAASATTLPPPDTVAPSVPTGLTATPVSANVINLSWTASTDNFAVTGYKVFRDGGATAIATVTTGTTFADGGLLPSSTHSYTVSAFDAAGNNSAKSAPASATTLSGPPDTTPPSVPTGLTATAASATTINLSWTASTDNLAVAGYKVFRDGGATAIATVTTGTTYSDTGLVSATTHSYTVEAFDGSNNMSAPSATATATTLDNVAPSVPTGLTATASGTTTIDLTWTASTDNLAVTGYKIFRDNGATEIATVTSGTAFTDTGLTPSSTHSYTVSAFDAAGNNSAKTAAATATTRALPTLTNLTLNPTTVVGGNPATGTITLSAAAPTGGVVVTLASSDTRKATVPASVTVPAGATTVNFTITTLTGQLGGGQNPVTITATLGGVGRSATLNITR